MIRRSQDALNFAFSQAIRAELLGIDKFAMALTWKVGKLHHVLFEGDSFWSQNSRFS